MFTTLDTREIMRHLLASGVPVRLTARGDSMIPTICSADRVVIAGARAGDMRAGDLGLYLSSGHLYAHRFVGWCDDPTIGRALQFACDTRARPDQPVRADSFIGRVVAVERAARDGAVMAVPRMAALAPLLVALRWAVHQLRVLAGT
jgi:hypothetical protein